MQDDMEDLFDAARNGDVAAIEQTIAKDRSIVDARDEAGHTLLQLAAAKDHAALLLTLLEAGADVNPRLNSWQTSPVHTAAYIGHQHVVDILLAAGADLTVNNYSGRREARIANKYGYTPAAAYLQSIANGKTACPTPESVGLDMNKRMDALELLGKPLGEFTEAERRRKAQRETREGQRQEALRGGGI